MIMVQVASYWKSIPGHVEHPACPDVSGIYRTEPVGLYSHLDTSRARLTPRGYRLPNLYISQIHFSNANTS